MTPQDAPGAPAATSARGNTAPPRQPTTAAQAPSENRNTRQGWTPEEENLVRQHYPHGGVKGTQAAGVNRGSSGIRARAATLGIKYTGPGSYERRPAPDPAPATPPTWRDELEALAQSNPTPSEYAQGAARIHAKRRAHQTRIAHARMQRTAGNRT